MLALRPGHRGDLGFEHGLHHRSAGSHAHRQQPLTRHPGDISQREHRLLRQLRPRGGLGRLRELDSRYGSRRAVAFLRVFFGRITRDLPPGRPQEGDRHLKFHSDRDNLASSSAKPSHAECSSPRRTSTPRSAPSSTAGTTDPTLRLDRDSRRILETATVENFTSAPLDSTENRVLGSHTLRRPSLQESQPSLRSSAPEPLLESRAASLMELPPACSLLEESSWATATGRVGGSISTSLGWEL